MLYVLKYVAGPTQGISSMWWTMCRIMCITHLHYKSWYHKSNLVCEWHQEGNLSNYFEQWDEPPYFDYVCSNGIDS